MSILSKAIKLAAEAHEEQTDKADQPYILHPIRVMLRFEDEQERIAAILHDVIEDTHHTRETLLAEGIAPTVVRSIELLSKPDRVTDEASYVKWVSEVVREDPIARRVKRADIADNIDVLRLAKLGPKDLARVQKYHAAYRALD